MTSRMLFFLRRPADRQAWVTDKKINVRQFSRSLVRPKASAPTNPGKDRTPLTRLTLVPLPLFTTTLAPASALAAALYHVSTHRFKLHQTTTATMSSEAKNNYDSDRPAGQGFSTISLHHGQTLDSDHRARAPPIYASTSFAFEDAQHGADLFALKKLGPIYTRIMNPTAHVLEYRLAKLEGSGCDLDGAHPSALATASGQSAQMIAIMTICQPGDHIIAASDLYGGTYSQFTNMFPNMGIQTSMVDGQNLDAVKAAFKENTKAVYYETLGNPSFNVPDFEAVSALCKEKKVPLIVDNTFGMAGYTCRPIKFGANIVTASCTKWIGGHGNTIGGIVVDGNNFIGPSKKRTGQSSQALLLPRLATMV